MLGVNVVYVVGLGSGSVVGRCVMEVSPEIEDEERLV
jgi:hypothetical protein